MENEFAQIMSEKSDEELIKIVTAEKENYQIAAIEAATSEITKRSIDPIKFDELKLQFDNEKITQQKVELSKVHLGSRILNFMVDTFLSIMTATFTFIFISFFLRFMTISISNETYRIALVTYQATVFCGYYIFMETKYQKTIGKFITKTKVVKLNGDKPSRSDIVVRTFCRFIPFDRISFLFGTNGIHDTLSKTKVVKENPSI